MTNKTSESYGYNANRAQLQEIVAAKYRTRAGQRFLLR